MGPPHLTQESFFCLRVAKSLQLILIKISHVLLRTCVIISLGHGASLNNFINIPRLFSGYLLVVQALLGPLPASY